MEKKFEDKNQFFKPITLSGPPMNVNKKMSAKDFAY